MIEPMATAQKTTPKSGKNAGAPIDAAPAVQQMPNTSIITPPITCATELDAEGVIRRLIFVIHAHAAEMVAKSRTLQPAHAARFNFVDRPDELHAPFGEPGLALGRAGDLMHGPAHVGFHGAG